MTMHDVGRFLEALAEFLGRYWIFFSIWIFAIVVNVRRFLKWRKRTRALVDPALTADWSDRRSSILTGKTRGVWGGRIATLRPFPSTDRSSLAIEATLATATPGRFLIERGDSGILTRQLRIGAPPLVTPPDPGDRGFRVRSTDRLLTDRLLTDAKARDAIAAALAGPSDEVSLGRGRFVIRRRFPRADPPGVAATQSLTALREMSRVLG